MSETPLYLKEFKLSFKFSAQISIVLSQADPIEAKISQIKNLTDMQLEAYYILKLGSPADSARIMPQQLGFTITKSDLLDIIQINKEMLNVKLGGGQSGKNNLQFNVIRNGIVFEEEKGPSHGDKNASSSDFSIPNLRAVKTPADTLFEQT